MTFESFIQSFPIFLDTLEEIKQKVSSPPVIQPPPKELLSIEETAEYLGVSVSGLRQNKTIPRHKQLGKIYFFRSEVLDTIKQSKIESKPIIQTKSKNGSTKINR